MESSTAKRKKKVFNAKKKIQNMTKEQIRVAVEKKRIGNAAALAIVERLIEPQVDQWWLLENSLTKEPDIKPTSFLIHINQCHFQDAVEERSITKCCGYPLCDRPLSNIPSKQFHISTKQNKVYDITDRKNYCSNVCYKSSVFLKEQLFTSPLWLRDCEDVTSYQLYDCAPTSGIAGLEVDLGSTSPVQADEINVDLPEEAEVVAESASEDEMFEDAKEDMETESSAEVVVEEDLNVLPPPPPAALVELTLNTPEPAELAIDCPLAAPRMTPFRATHSPRPRPSRTRKPPAAPAEDVGEKINGVFRSWLTLESLVFLFGEAEVRTKFAAYASHLDNVHRQGPRDPLIYERYEEICRKLNVLDLRERVIEGPPNCPSKPLPDFDQLKQQTQELELKVRSFYRGDARVGFTPDPTPTEDDGDELPPSVLPLTDRYAVRATRRRIVLDKLQRTLPDILSALNLCQFSLRTEIREFVHTLSLSSTNIVMNPTEWTLVALVFIRMLTVTSEPLRQVYLTDLTQRRLVNLLMTYNLDVAYLEGQMLNVEDIEQIIRNSQ